MEPTKHQYDSDAAACFAFLQWSGLLSHFKLNIETNHATLAGHTIQHELAFARANGILGSVDANQGDELLGWDTDQFPTNHYTTTFMMHEILASGGLHSGGLNFDAKPRRGSNTPRDLAISHIAGMDSFARGLEVAHAMRESGALAKPLAERYSGWRKGLGASIVSGKEDFSSLEKAALDAPSFDLLPGGQEELEAIVNQYI
jgi:xylose isomerase